MLACMLELCLHLIIPLLEFFSYSSVCLYKLRCNLMGEHWMFVPGVHVVCHLEVRRESFLWGTPNSSCLICPHHSELWPTALDAPFLASFLFTAPPLSQRASQLYLSPLSWSSSHIGDKGVFYPWGYIIEIPKESLVLLSTWKTQYGSGPCQSCVHRDVPCTGKSSFISFFVSSMLTGLDQGLGESGQWQAKSWPDPLPLLLQFHGASQEDAQASLFAGHSDLFNPTQMAPITRLSTNIDYYSFP